jgi:hypothetical protein
VARLAVRLEEPAGAGGPGALTSEAEWTDADWAAARDHCRLSWLRGRFLAAGSISLGHAGTHAEFVVDPMAAEALAERLSEAGFPASVRVRRRRGVVTWKSTETVLAFLRAAGAGSSVLELEARLVTRQMQAHLNRVLNAESANLARSVIATARQLAVIGSLERSGRLASLPETERAVAAARRAAPEQNLTELAAALGLSRARVQRAFERLESEAGNDTADEPRDGPR